MLRMRISLLIAICLFPCVLAAEEPGDSVIVIYNNQVADSRDVAYHYAEARHVPRVQVFGLELPAAETITRLDYHEKLEKPLLDLLQGGGLFQFDLAHASDGRPGKLISAKIRYAVVCYGVPLRILEDPSLVESNAAKIQPELRRNGAAVDAELTLLPYAGKYELTGAVANSFFGATNVQELGPRQGLLFVGRLDGPTAAASRQLVDKAIQAENDGLWGRAYFDARGITNAALKAGDDWILGAAEITRHFGYETVIDNKPETFSRDFPMSQIALYAGWYDGRVSGPFSLPHVEFMPGAFAYHLFSYSANTLHDPVQTNQSWCEAFVDRGATATMGCVDEPYLEGTPDIAMFFARWLDGGFTFGEAAFVSQRALSWQTTVIGDPLYRPFGRVPRVQHEALLAKQSDLVAWSFVRIFNVERELGMPLAKEIDAIKSEAWTARSPVLSEKLGDLYLEAKDPSNALRAYKQALKLKPTPQQRVRLELAVNDLKKKPGS